MSKDHQKISKLLFSLLIIFVTVKPAHCQKELNITVDPRLELLSVVEFISNYDQNSGMLTRFDFKYKRDLHRYFSKFRDHKAVKIFDRMSTEDFNGNAPSDAIIHLSDPPQLEIQVPFIENNIKRAGSKEKLLEFIEALREFAVDTDFMDFFKRNEPVFNVMINRTKRHFKGLNIVTTIENYFRMRQNSYNIIHVPLFHNGGFGAIVDTPDGKRDVFFIGGTQRVIDDIPEFGNLDALLHIGWHEFSHTFINPVTEKHLDEINKYDSLWDPIRIFLKKSGYPRWKTGVNEHLVRAAVVRLRANHFRDRDSFRSIEWEKKNGFFYIEI